MAVLSVIFGASFWKRSLLLFCSFYRFLAVLLQCWSREFAAFCRCCFERRLHGFVRSMLLALCVFVLSRPWLCMCSMLASDRGRRRRNGVH